LLNNWLYSIHLKIFILLSLNEQLAHSCKACANVGKQNSDGILFSAHTNSYTNFCSPLPKSCMTVLCIFLHLLCFVLLKYCFGVTEIVVTCNNSKKRTPACNFIHFQVDGRRVRAVGMISILLRYHCKEY